MIFTRLEIRSAWSEISPKAMINSFNCQFVHFLQVRIEHLDHQAAFDVIAMALVVVDRGHERPDALPVFHHQVDLLDHQLAAFHRNADEVLHVQHDDLGNLELLGADQVQDQLEDARDAVDLFEQVHDVLPRLGDQRPAVHEHVDLFLDLVGLGLEFVGLVDQKPEFLAEALVQAGIHGLDEMLLGAGQVFQILVDQGFKLLLFFEEKAKHRLLREGMDRIRVAPKVVVVLSHLFLFRLRLYDKLKPSQTNIYYHGHNFF